jgi:predicted membrane protein
MTELLFRTMLLEFYLLSLQFAVYYIYIYIYIGRASKGVNMRYLLVLENKVKLWPTEIRNKLHNHSFAIHKC